MNLSDAHGAGSPHPGPPARRFSDLLRVVVRECSQGTCVIPHGELDLATTPQLQRVLDDLSGAVVLDLRELSFIDCTGLHLLLCADARSRRDGLELCIAVGPVAQRVLALAGIADRFSYTTQTAPPRLHQRAGRQHPATADPQRGQTPDTDRRDPAA